MWGYQSYFLLKKQPAAVARKKVNKSGESEPKQSAERRGKAP